MGKKKDDVKNGKIMLKNVRLSFPSLWETEIYNGDDTEKYAATFLIGKNEAQAKALKTAIKECAQEQFGTPLPKSLKNCLSDGDEKEYDGYADHYSVKATTKRRPLVIDRSRVPVMEDDNLVYAGCYVNALISLWAMDNKYGKRILANLEAIQFVRPGEPFGSGGVTPEAFDDLGHDVTHDEDLDDDDIPF